MQESDPRELAFPLQLLVDCTYTKTKRLAKEFFSRSCDLCFLHFSVGTNFQVCQKTPSLRLLRHKQTLIVPTVALIGSEAALLPRGAGGSEKVISAQKKDKPGHTPITDGPYTYYRWARRAPGTSAQSSCSGAGPACRSGCAIL